MSGFDLVQNPDGAGFQAQAVLAYVRYHIGSGIEKSWDKTNHRYAAEPKVTRYDNGREQGYIVWLRSRDYTKQINIAFYEHRNSDSICAVVSNNRTFNAPVLSDITEVMKDKHDTTKSFGFGKAADLAEWIVERLNKFWANTETGSDKDQDEDYPPGFGPFDPDAAWQEVLKAAEATRKREAEAARKRADAEAKKEADRKARDEANRRARDRARDQDDAYRRSRARSGARHWSEVLEVNRNCTHATAKAAWRKLALKHHPDSGGDTARMQEINAAWTDAQRDLKAWA
jgi:hypothetical protein